MLHGSHRHLIDDRKKPQWDHANVSARLLPQIRTGRLGHLFGIANSERCHPHRSLKRAPTELLSRIGTWRLPQSRKCFRLLERLVGSEANDGQPEGVHGQFVVLHLIAEDVGNAGSPLLSLDLSLVRGIREDLLELDPRGVG